MAAVASTTDQDFHILAVDVNDPQAAEQFAKSLHETGFAVLKNHGISKEEIEALYQEWNAFFDSDECKKHLNTLHESTKGKHGFFPMRSEHAKGSDVADLKRFYHYHKINHPDLPPLPSGLKEKTDRFLDEMDGLAKQLLGWLDAQMPVEVKARLSMPLAEMIIPRDGEEELLRILDYPALDGTENPGEVRAKEHEDIDLITLLSTGNEPGLQAKDRAGNWHDVPCDASYITVNAGDMLQMATKGYYPSTTHRVVNPPTGDKHRRNTAPLFVHPSNAVVLDKENGKTAGEALTERLREIGLDAQPPQMGV